MEIRLNNALTMLICKNHYEIVVRIAGETLFWIDCFEFTTIKLRSCEAEKTFLWLAVPLRALFDTKNGSKKLVVSQFNETFVCTKTICRR